MNAENMQQEHTYNGRIQEFFPLFDKSKKENDLIYNARVDFNTVKFLIEHSDWNEDENKNKAYEFILQECNKIKKARKELEREVQKRLKDYIEGSVKEDGIKIYGNHASITLEDNKKEFKVSEFLNSDFCQKNGISGFSMLHSDGKSGMHGFIAEEERKIRYYTVTNGSYEMTLNWYVNGEKCIIKINIDKDGVDLIERNRVANAQLQANKDVKIGGLFLHQIQFRKKGKGQANEMQKDSQSFETITRIDVSSRDVGIQDTYINRGVGSRTTSRSDSKSDLGYESKGESSQNKRTPPPQLPRTTSLLKKDVFDDKANIASTRSIYQNQDYSRQKDEHYGSPTFTTFGYTASGEKETVAEEDLQVKSIATPTQDIALKKVAGAFKFECAKKSVNTGDKQSVQDDVASILAKKSEAEFLHSEDFNNEINSQEVKENRWRRQVARKESYESQVYITFNRFLNGFLRARKSRYRYHLELIHLRKVLLMSKERIILLSL